MKTDFYVFFEEAFSQMLDQFKLKNSPYFDQIIFNETSNLIENYDKLD